MLNTECVITIAFKEEIFHQMQCAKLTNALLPLPIAIDDENWSIIFTYNRIFSFENIILFKIMKISWIWHIFLGRLFCHWALSIDN